MLNVNTKDSMLLTEAVKNQQTFDEIERLQDIQKQIQSLNILQRQSVKANDLRAADLFKSRKQLLRRQETQVHCTFINKSNARQEISLQEQNDVEKRQFERHWSQKLKRFQELKQAEVSRLRQLHNLQLMRMKELRGQKMQSTKYSLQVLKLRSKLRGLTKLRQYKSALEIETSLKALEEIQNTQWINQQTAKYQFKIQRLIRRQSLEIEAFETKFNNMYNDLKVQQAREAIILEKKFKVRLQNNPKTSQVRPSRMSLHYSALMTPMKQSPSKQYLSATKHKTLV